MTATQPAPFTGDHHFWTVHRHARTFTVRVIEPATYEPEHHGALFNAVMTELVSPAPTLVDPIGSSSPEAAPEPFDLVTFPEAFVPEDAFLETLEAFGEASPPGCFHVGLRPTSASQHMFSRSQMLELVAKLSKMPHTVAADFDGFRAWAAAQQEKYRFNLGCLFAVDVKNRVRICLHPKIVRSKFETHPLPDHLMAEGTHLALVTLRPANKLYFSVTMQPLLCSDALSLPTDHNTPPPLEAVNKHAQCFGEAPPDHVDVVSVATCTPQTSVTLQAGQPYRLWHEQFQDTFKRAANDGGWTRHHHAAFVLSNFLTNDAGLGGLSGVFLPVDARLNEFPEQVLASSWGRPSPTEETPSPGANRWSTPDEGADALDRWQGRGFVAALSPFTHPKAAVRIFGFTIHRLPRDNPRWDKPAGLTGLEIYVGTRTDNGTILFEREVLRDAS